MLARARWLVMRPRLHGADVDDAASPLAPHLRDHRPRHSHDSEEVRLKERPRQLDRAFLRAGRGDAEAGVVHEQINPSLAAKHLGHRRADGFITVHIQL